MEPAAVSLCRLLVVDDDEAIGLLLVRMLRRLGLEATSTQSAERALSALAGDPSIGCLLTDIAMPGMDGLALARAVRESFPNVAVILMSGYVPEGLVDGDLVDLPLLSKPLVMTDLADALAVALSQRVAVNTA